MSIHFFYGLFFVIVSMGITLLYFLVPISLILLFRVVWLRRKGKLATLWSISAWKSIISAKVAIYLLVCFVGFHAMLYVKLRWEFMGEDNANLVAKEYFVAGQMVNAPLSIGSRFIHPENLLLKPYWLLQEKIYEVGIEYLPEKDGEKAVWRQKWFLHPYVRNHHKTKDWTNLKYSPDMVELLDDIWQAMEVMATSDFADSQMQYNQYYRNFPGMASYWTINKDQYFEKSFGSAWLMAEDSFLIDRTAQLVSWLMELEEKWQETEYTQGLINEHPIIRVLHQGTLMGSFFMLIHKDIINKSFRCENDYVLMYRDVRNRFAAPKSPLFSLPSQKRKGHKEAYIDSEYAHFFKRTLKQYCGYEIAGKEKPSMFDSHDSSVRHLFKKEYVILEEIFHVGDN